MRKNTQEFLWLIGIVLILVCGVGVAIGFSIGSQFPNSNWVGFASTVAQILAVIGTICGAYYVATVQRRAEEIDKIKRIKYLVNETENKIDFIFRLAQRKNFEQAIYNETLKIISIMQKIPIEFLPGRSLYAYNEYIEGILYVINELQLIEQKYINNRLLLISSAEDEKFHNSLSFFYFHITEKKVNLEKTLS